MDEQVRAQVERLHATPLMAVVAVSGFPLPPPADRRDHVVVGQVWDILWICGIAARTHRRKMPKCTAGPPRMARVRNAYFILKFNGRC